MYVAARLVCLLDAGGVLGRHAPVNTGLCGVTTAVAGVIKFVGLSLHVSATEGNCAGVTVLMQQNACRQHSRRCPADLLLLVLIETLNKER